MHTKTSDSSEWKISREDMFNMPREQRIGEKLPLGDEYVYVLRVGPPLFDDFDYSPTPELVADTEPLPIYYASQHGDKEVTLGLPGLKAMFEARGENAADLMRLNLRAFCVFVAAHANKGTLFEGRQDYVVSKLGSRVSGMMPTVREDHVSFWTYDDRHPPERLVRLSVSVAGWQLKTEEVMELRG